MALYSVFRSVNNSLTPPGCPTVSFSLALAAQSECQIPQVKDKVSNKTARTSHRSHRWRPHDVSTSVQLGYKFGDSHNAPSNLVLRVTHWKHYTLGYGFIIKHTNGQMKRYTGQGLEESQAQEPWSLELEVHLSPGTLICSLIRKLHRALVFRLFIWGFMT